MSLRKTRPGVFDPFRNTSSHSGPRSGYHTRSNSTSPSSSDRSSKGPTLNVSAPCFVPRGRALHIDDNIKPATKNKSKMSAAAPPFQPSQRKLKGREECLPLTFTKRLASAEPISNMRRIVYPSGIRRLNPSTKGKGNLR
jgi:hypothetical protein